MAENKNFNSIDQKLLHLAILISIVSGFLFFYGYVYYKTFFQRLSIPSSIIFYIPTHEIFLRGAFYILVLLLILFAFYGWNLKKPNPLEVFFENMFMVFLIAILLIGINFMLFHINYIIIFSILILVMVFIAHKYRNKSLLKNVLFESNCEIKFKFSLCILFCLFIFASMDGTMQAEANIQGINIDSLGVQVSLLEKSNIQLQNKSIILIMILQENYFFVEKNETIPKNPKIYIVPKDNIEMITINEKGTGINRTELLRILIRNQNSN